MKRGPLKMHVVLAVLISVMASVQPAQAYYCSRPSPPSLPDGSSSNVDEMKDAEREVNSYLDEMRDYIECLNREAGDAADEANGLQDDWNNQVAAFN